jgi:hypothetical protein
VLALLLAPSIASGEGRETPPGSSYLGIWKTGFGTGTVECRFNGAGSFGSCPSDQLDGTLVEVKATADSGFHLTALKGNGSAAGHCSGSTCSFTITEETTVTAAFNPPLSTLSIGVAGTGSDNVFCRFNGGPEEPCTSSRPMGTAVTVIAFAADSEFIGFSDGTGSASGCSTSPCSFTLEEVSSLMASFDSSPSFESESVSGVTSTNAILEAKINPDEREIVYQFQLVVDPSEYASTFTCPPEPSNFFCSIIAEWLPRAEGALPIRFLEGESKTVSLNLEAEVPGYALLPGTTYHYRVIGARHIFTEDTFEFEEPIAFGPDRTFTTPEEEPTGPTNRRTLSITKSANGPGGLGSVSSQPKGIKCGNNCSSAVASMYENSSVELTAKPGTHSAFSQWEGGDCEGSHSPTCPVTMDTAESIEAVFTTLPAQSEKTITPAEPLTVSKAGTGAGTVKGSGIACEAECTETVVLYQGPNPPKAAKTVTLAATPAFGSEFTGWSGAGCSGIGSCVVTMSAAENVTATFTAKPNGTLSIEKALNTGTVTSKPKGIKCAAACVSQSASMPQGESILLTAMAASGMTFSKWEGGDCEGITVPTCTVEMDASEPIKAVFTGTPKAVSPEDELTLTKGGSGLGTVKGTGLACEALCTSTTSIYKGPTSYPAKTVTLEAASAPGSKPVQWSGCDTINEGKCVVTMTGSKAVTASFDELE